jgi:cell wall assembly regulator SMI1
MSRNDENLGCRLRAYDEKQFGRGATAEQIMEAEQTLKVAFPESYRAFLRDFGWGGVGHIEIFGLGDDVPAYLDLISVTRSERTEMRPQMPTFLIPIMNDGAGNHYCLDTRQFFERECAVVFWDHELGEYQQIERVASTFEEWLQAMLDDLDE